MYLALKSHTSSTDNEVTQRPSEKINAISSTHCRSDRCCVWQLCTAELSTEARLEDKTDALQNWLSWPRREMVDIWIRKNHQFLPFTPTTAIPRVDSLSLHGLCLDCLHLWHTCGKYEVCSAVLTLTRPCHHGHRIQQRIWSLKRPLPQLLCLPLLFCRCLAPNRRHGCPAGPKGKTEGCYTLASYMAGQQGSQGSLKAYD